MTRVLDDGLAKVPPGVPADGELLVGPVAEMIAEAAKDFDLLLLGSRGRGPLLRTLLGSVSGPIARNAPCPVLVLPARSRRRIAGSWGSRVAGCDAMTTGPAEQAFGRITTRDGAQLVVRPIRATDKEALREAFDHLSADSRYDRFLAPIKRLTSHELEYLTELDHFDHEALIAISPDGDLVAVSRYVCLEDRPRTAEVAVTVADAWQGRGIGTLLLRRLAARARKAGVVNFLGVCLAHNERMRELFEELGPEVTTRSMGSGRGGRGRAADRIARPDGPACAPQQQARRRLTDAG